MSDDEQAGPSAAGRAAAATVRGAMPTVEQLVADVAITEAIGRAVARGYFRPSEDELLLSWFARFLTVRGGLWEALEGCVAALDDVLPRHGSIDAWRCFLAGYGAACLVVRLDRHLVEQLATDALSQRKLNEGDERYRLPRKQFTHSFDSLASPRRALRMLEAMRFLAAHREDAEALRDDGVVGAVVTALPDLERGLDRSKRRYARLARAYAGHALRRRLASARQQTAFGVLESGGRAVSEVRAPFQPKRLKGDRLAAFASLLRPGDVCITRHEGALTNLFLPGYWPHAALYVGSPADRERLGIRLDPERAARWNERVRTLEALKDGVRFRPLSETLAVDAVVVLRPRLSEAAIARGIGRAALHEGKLYNFDFDFFRSDRLVCTEVVYRAYDGLEGFEMPLAERAGRPSLSAEDLLDLCVDADLFEAVALFGARGCEHELVTGAEARARLAATYRDDAGERG